MDRVSRLANRLSMVSSFSNKDGFLARPTHCLVRASNVYKSFVRSQCLKIEQDKNFIEF